jgi:hypothetical protein
VIDLNKSLASSSPFSSFSNISNASFSILSSVLASSLIFTYKSKISLNDKFSFLYLLTPTTKKAICFPISFTK